MKTQCLMLAVCLMAGVCTTGVLAHQDAAKTQRERDWLAAIEEVYKDYDKVDQDTRSLNYEKEIERLTRKYPHDVEAKVFYALALNETALHSDKTYAKQLRAV